MKTTLVALTAVLILACGITAEAHHAFAGSYILDQTATVEGTIVQFDIRNPHSFLNLEVKDADGKITRWGIEWGSVSQLRATGISQTSLKIGDKITVVGAPSRDPLEHKTLLRKVQRTSDGFSWGDRPGEVIKGYEFPATAPTPAAR